MLFSILNGETRWADTCLVGQWEGGSNWYTEVKLLTPHWSLGSLKSLRRLSTSGDMAPNLAGSTAKCNGQGRHYSRSPTCGSTNTMA